MGFGRFCSDPGNLKGISIQPLDFFRKLWIQNPISTTKVRMIDFPNVLAYSFERSKRRTSRCRSCDGEKFERRRFQKKGKTSFSVSGSSSLRVFSVAPFNTVQVNLR